MKQQESDKIEFKQAWKDEYLKVICAFANTEGGGLLIIGKKDNNQTIGIKVKDAKHLLEMLPNKIRDVLGIYPQIMLVKEKNKSLIHIIVDYSYAPISYEGKFYVRSGSTIQELKGKELSKFLISKSGKDWEDYIVEKSSIKDINPITIKKFKKIAEKRLPLVKEKLSDIKFLEKLDLIENGRLKRAGMLLFGNNPQRFFKSSYIKIGKFRNDTDIISTDNIEGNLFEQVEKAIELLRTKYLVSEIKFEGIYRKEELEYPEQALREAIINAVIHRDYIGAHTQIKVYPDKLIIWNEGTLPNDIKLEDLKKNHPSRPRNTLLADVFYKAGLIEAWGRGTVMITDECKKAGLPEPEFKEEFGGFSVYFYKDIYTEENLRKMGLNERQIKAVMYVKERGKITNKEYRSLYSVSRITASRDFANLIKKKVFQTKGKGKKDLYYCLSDAKMMHK